MINHTLAMLHLPWQNKPMKSKNNHVQQEANKAISKRKDPQPHVLGNIKITRKKTEGLSNEQQKETIEQNFQNHSFTLSVESNGHTSPPVHVPLCGSLSLSYCHQDQVPKSNHFIKHKNNSRIEQE